MDHIAASIFDCVLLLINRRFMADWIAAHLHNAIHAVFTWRLPFFVCLCVLWGFLWIFEVSGWFWLDFGQILRILWRFFEDFYGFLTVSDSFWRFVWIFDNFLMILRGFLSNFEDTLWIFEVFWWFWQVLRIPWGFLSILDNFWTVSDDFCGFSTLL